MIGSSSTRPAGLKRQAASNPFKISTLKEGGWAETRRAASPPTKRPGIPYTEGWVCPRVGLGGHGKSRLFPRSDPQTFHPVASRYTE